MTEARSMIDQRDNRKRILGYALTLFVTHGYDAVGVQAICDAVGVTKPTLYHYFGNKRGLLDAMIAEWCVPFVRDLASVARYRGDLPMSLMEVVRAYFIFAQRQPQVYRLALAAWFAAPQNDVYEASAEVHQQQQQLLEALFKDATADHGNIRGRQRIFAATLIGTINTYVVLWLNDHAALDDAAVRAAVSQFSYGIYS